MGEPNIPYNKFEVGYTKSDQKKSKYRLAIQNLIEKKQLFVAPVKPGISGQRRADAYKIIHPIYKSAELKDTLVNCFACSKCKHIFLHLPRNGTAPFTSHKCYKEFNTAVQEAKTVAAEAKNVALEANIKAKKAKKSVEKLYNLSLSSDEYEDEDGEVKQSEKPSKRPRHANVVANAIEKFVTMGIEGKRVIASKIIDDIPNDFSTSSW